MASSDISVSFQDYAAWLLISRWCKEPENRHAIAWLLTLNMSRVSLEGESQLLVVYHHREISYDNVDVGMFFYKPIDKNRTITEIDFCSKNSHFWWRFCFVDTDLSKLLLFELLLFVFHTPQIYTSTLIINLLQMTQAPMIKIMNETIDIFSVI